MDIVLLTFNARYHHASFGLRYLKANMAELEDSCAILEFDLEARPADVLEKVLEQSPKIVGLGVYVWNAAESLALARQLKALAPEIKLVLGGPEVSFEHARQEICELADHVVCGEGDLAFPQLCRDLLAGKPREKIVGPLLVIHDLSWVSLPYRLYADEDLSHRTIYVESSRGCPFTCEFCLSSLNIPVRRFPIDDFLREMEQLIERGCRQFKFVDRTFNVHPGHSAAVLRFFLERLSPGMFVHFEIIPDHLPDSVFELLAQFPPGTLQLEVGVQTFNEEVAKRIGRKQRNDRVEATLQKLRTQTCAHIHADLIAGLPGESLESFAAGFDRLLRLRPHEIQLGILKRLRGAPIARHTQAFEMIYSPDAPYELLRNNLLDFATMQHLKRVARYWDLYYNSGNFERTIPLLLAGDSAFERFSGFARFIYERTGKTHAISLQRQFLLAYEWLGRSEEAGKLLADDYARPGRRDLPDFLQPYQVRAPRPQAQVTAPARQRRHLA